LRLFCFQEPQVGGGKAHRPQNRGAGGADAERRGKDRIVAAERDFVSRRFAQASQREKFAQ